MGQKVSPADYAPEFHAKTLPPGSAPAANTFKPNPVNEIPGQADNDLVNRQHGKEETKTGALDMPGATSADVHKGLGHPGQGQTSSELHNDGKQSGAGLKGEGGSGMTDDANDEAKRLQQDDHPSGPLDGHNATLEGAEEKGHVHADQLQSESQKVKQGDYTRHGEKGTGNVDKK